MATMTRPPGNAPRQDSAPHRPEMDRPPHAAARLGFFIVLLGGIAFAGFSIFNDTRQVGEPLALGVFAFLGVALLIALGFEFVNGFHDTANAVATVIYTHSLPAPIAVVWSGFFNFLGVLTSSGAVAYTVVTLLPVDLILNVGSAAGYAMIFALLLAAVIWNLATWYVGLPNSSSHALIGSILGVGLANQLIARGSGTSGVDWSQVQKVFSSLLLSPLIGFGGALLLLLVMKRVLRNPRLYREPEGNAPPPTGIRALLILTCTSVSFAHGSNDGQKGMGLIMLILIGCAPTAYALNRTMPEAQVAGFVRSASESARVFQTHGQGGVPVAIDQARSTLTQALRAKKADSPQVFQAAATLSRDVAQRVQSYGSLAKVPAAATPNLRNDMYLVMDTAKAATKPGSATISRFSAADQATLSGYQQGLEKGTRYIPTWVKLAVALALGLGTMVGWKRIVVTVGEKIGKSHLTYGMGASAELVTAATILLADRYGLPVSTTHILSSGVAGASVANGSGLQFATIRNMISAWVLTLPIAMALSGGLYWIFLTAVRAF